MGSNIKRDSSNEVKRAVVMGATSGIGMEVALLLAKKGWRVGIAGRREEKLRQIKDSTDGIVCCKQIDITKDNAPQLLNELIEELGGMDLYFHSSGIGWQNVALDIEKEMRTVETNGVGFTRMVTAAFNYFTVNGGGQIACITSIARTAGLGAAPSYSATKRFQSHYLECLSQLSRMRKLNIRITEIRPGFVATDLLSGSRYPLQLKASNVAKSIVKVVLKRKEIATLDWRYRILVFLWRMIPRCVWVRLKRIHS